MRNRTFPTTAIMLSLTILLLLACKQPANPCVQSLRDRDAQIAQKTDSLILRRNEITPESYRVALEKLRIEEKQMFGEVENCDFGKDLQAYNYWHRGRLKFPGKIEMELQRIEHESLK
jgi:hypothetical protein